jgi:hypothetical protein
MAITTDLERIYQQIELTRGLGDRRRSRLCIMSFVALLAGEPHSDTPAAASPLICRFAIPLNDAMPDHMRQRLKPFAPRILGTRDGYDHLRTAILVEAVRAELLPRIAEDFTPILMTGPARLSTLSLPLKRISLAQAYQWVEKAVLPGTGDAAREIAAGAIARLIALCGCRTHTPDRREWYWLKAIDLLDRLCDVRADSGSGSLSPERLQNISEMLAHNKRPGSHGVRAVGLLSRVRKAFPALTW